MLDRIALLADCAYATGTDPRWFVYGYMYGHRTNCDRDPVMPPGIGQQAAFTNGLCEYGSLIVDHHLGVPAN